MKTCAKCGEEKPIDQFPKDRRSPSGVYSYCRVCSREKTKQQRLKNPNAVREAHLKGRYGLDIEQFTELLKAQDHKCAICGDETILCVDHDHKTGEVRGLLCHPCNLALGKLKDSIPNLKNAIRYLSK